MRSCCLFLLVGFVMFSCNGGNEKKVDEPAKGPTVDTPPFNSDSAYAFVARQVKFGPRVPNSKAHRDAGNYLINTLKKSGGIIKIQEFEASTFDGQRLALRNIIAGFNPEKQKRILLAAHWDTRPFADKDSTKRNAHFDGANDGASGVGVLLEVARNMGKIAPSVGVDIILFDGEDWGEKHGAVKQVPLPEGVYSWWCLGSQYWARHKHPANYTAYYGILLDMVGAKDSHFYREGSSQKYAAKIVEKVWATADQLGYSSYFVRQDEGAIVDDHVFVNEFAHIPMIDIVHFQPGVGYFGDYHHSQKDNLNLISKETLGVTGSVLMHVIYGEE
jgi:glutaminyl-peptide cyclotransferase